MQLKVIKYKLYPNDAPTGYAVGFNVLLDNGRSFYAHTIVDLVNIEEGKTDEEIVQIAYGQLEAHISDRMATLSYTPSIEGIEIGVNGEYETQAVNTQNKLEELTQVVDTMLGAEEGVV